MALEGFLHSNRKSAMPMILPINGAGGNFEAFASRSSLQNKDHFDSILSMAQINSNFGTDETNSTILGKSSTSRSAIGYDATVAIANLTLPTGAYLLSHGNSSMESYISLPSIPMPISNDNPVNVLYTDDAFSHLFQAREKESKKQHLDNTTGFTGLYRTDIQTCHDSLPVRMKLDRGTLIPILRKPRIDVNQENIQQQQHEIFQELLLKQIPNCNPELKEMIKQYRQKSQLQEKILHSVPQLTGFHLQIPKHPPTQQTKSLLHNQVTQQETFAPVLDGGICSGRFKQYLYQLRNNKHDNGISYWRKFVAEYYAPAAQKRWCFSKYENIELHTAGSFCPKSMEISCCQLCGLKSGKRLKACFEIIPRLFKIKYEIGMLDEILYLDSPQAHKVSSGVRLEYRKVIQESVYETFRVVHLGKLSVVFGHDLKILSWEFCIVNHEEYLQRTLFTPQVNQLVQAAEKCQDIQSCVSSKASSLDSRKVFDVFASAGIQIARNMQLPLVNDLGYPKRFIRCLQIAEVVESMKDLMTSSYDTEMGPIGCLNNYSQVNKADNKMKGKQVLTGAHNVATPPKQPRSGCHANRGWMTENGVISGSSLGFINFNDQLLGQNSPIASAGGKGQDSRIMNDPNQGKSFVQSFNSHLHNEALSSSLLRPQSCEHGKLPNQALVDNEMVAARKGKRLRDTYEKPNNEELHPQVTKQKNASSKELHYGEISNIAMSAQANLANPSTTAYFSKAVSHVNLSAGSQLLTVKAEPWSPEQLPEAAAGFTGIEHLSG